jgi:hypothetical protein
MMSGSLEWAPSIALLSPYTPSMTADWEGPHSWLPSPTAQRLESSVVGRCRRLVSSSVGVVVGRCRRLVSSMCLSSMCPRPARQRRRRICSPLWAAQRQAPQVPPSRWSFALQDPASSTCGQAFRLPMNRGLPDLSLMGLKEKEKRAGGEGGQPYKLPQVPRAKR